MVMHPNFIPITRLGSKIRLIRQTSFTNHRTTRLLLSTSANGSSSLNGSSHVHGTDDMNNISRQEEVRRVAHERLAGRRRFYKVVDVVSIAPISDETLDATVDSPISAGVDGTDSGSGIARPSKTGLSRSAQLNNSKPSYGVTLDNRRIKTPAGQSFEVPSLALAMAVAAEWDAQSTYINPAQMPLMTLSCTAIDQTAFDPETTIQNILRYLPNDTTSYLVDPAEDRVLARLQKQHWDGLRSWSKSVLGDKPATTYAVVSVGRGKGLPHSDTVYKKAEEFVRSLDIWGLTSMQCATVEAKSFLVGLGFVKSYLNAEQAIGAARVEEEFQISNWGCVEGGHDYDRLNCSIQMRSASFLLKTTQ